MYSRIPYSRGFYSKGWIKRYTSTVVSYVSTISTTIVRKLTIRRFTATVVSWFSKVTGKATSFAWYTPWLTGIVYKYDSLTGRKRR